MAYNVVILRAPQKAIQHLHPHMRNRVIAAIRSLAENPRPQGHIKLTGFDRFRVRVGDVRIQYEINDSILTVIVVSILPRDKVYH